MLSQGRIWFLCCFDQTTSYLKHLQVLDTKVRNKRSYKIEQWNGININSNWMEILFRSMCTLFLFQSLCIRSIYTYNYIKLALHSIDLVLSSDYYTCWRDLMLSTEGAELTVRRNKCLILITSKIYILPQEININLMTQNTAVSCD